MSACTRFPDDAQVLRYVTGELAEPELSAFEDHLFACDACLARVERYQAAQVALATRDLSGGPVGVVLPADDPPASGTRAAWWLGAVAAVLVVGLLGVVLWRPAAPAATRVAVTPDVPGGTAALAPASPSSNRATLGLAVLAVITPPPYLPVTTRGEAAADRFAAAMDAYTRGDWTTASQGLAEMEAPEAHFYKGVADLMLGRAADATRAFESARASGRQPYARESAYYLGKAALLRGDLAAARSQFEAAIDDGASTAREATRVLAALDAAP